MPIRLIGEANRALFLEVEVLKSIDMGDMLVAARAELSESMGVIRPAMQ